ncbi:PspA/IM30 family protein [Algicella marina]|uniref:PspA/IM30 family protein n=1 Tax=Algicella marina TaxID=2683284 RepID=A0A6P1SXC9_9RHOB|nr:PspA/IM30 family protein [Algicella marina]QHQ33993.1 PspA/IM30 family protein [Algicella marina]
MFRTLNTLMRGAAARQEEALVDRFAVDLLDQKVRDCETNLRAAKATLAALISRHRTEQRQLEAVNDRLSDMTARAEEALKAGAEDLVLKAAQAIAELENERDTRQKAVESVTARVERMRDSLDRAHRRVVDLRQAAMLARATDQERKAQKRFSNTITRTSDMTEAEELVERIMGQRDPFEEDEILSEIDADLTGKTARDDLAAAGYGPKLKTSAEDVIARLKAKQDK